MAIDTGKNIIDGVILGTSLATILTVSAPLIRIKIDSLSFTNYGSVNANLTVKIISKNESDGNGKFLIKEKIIRVNETYAAPEVIGQGIELGGTLRAFSSVATSIACTATGTEYFN